MRHSPDTTVTCGRAAPPSGPAAPTASTSPPSPSGRMRSTWPRRPPPPRRAPLRRLALGRGQGLDHGRPPPRRDPRPLRLPGPHRAGRRQPGRARLQPEAPAEAAAGADRRADADRCCEGIPARTPLELRDRAMFELAYSCGLRCEEIVNLDIDSFDFEEDQLRVLGKGSKTRLLPVGEPARRAVERYLQRGRRPLARRSARARPLPLQERPAPLQLGCDATPADLGRKCLVNRRRIATFT